MAMKYQKGTVYLCGEKVKMWYGKYLIYEKDRDGKEIRRHRNVSICPKANTPKWKAEQLLREIILKEVDTPELPKALIADDSVTFRSLSTSAAFQCGKESGAPLIARRTPITLNTT